MTSAIMKPFSKSVWIFPAACGALVPFCKVFQRSIRNAYITCKNVSVNMCFAHPDGPCTDFVRSCCEEVLQLQGRIPRLDDLCQDTEIKTIHNVKNFIGRINITTEIQQDQKYD